MTITLNISGYLGAVINTFY